MRRSPKQKATEQFWIQARSWECPGQLHERLGPEVKTERGEQGMEMGGRLVVSTLVKITKGHGRRAVREGGSQPGIKFCNENGEDVKEDSGR